jgi:dihydrolipoamide dehydrogenase
MADENQEFDVAVIGAGPGGYIAAIRAAQLELKTALVEKEPALGGTCLRIGCIPSKALLHSTEQLRFMKHEAEDHGIQAENVGVDLAKLLARKDKVVKQLTGGVGMLMKKNKVQVFQGTGKVTAEQTVEVTDAKDKQQTLKAKHIILASGSVPVELPNIKFDGETIVSSREALSFDKVPEKMVVIGGGAIGLELGSVWSRMGTEVTVLEFLPEIGAGFDKDLSKALLRSLKKQGLKFHLETKVTGVEVQDGKATVTAEKKGKETRFEADKVLMSVGRRAFTEGVVSDDMEVIFDRKGRFQVDSQFQTNVPGLYAIGDAVTGPMLAHKAEEEGVACAEIIAGKAGHVNYEVIPNVIYTSPEVAAVGMSEQLAEEKGHEVKTGKFVFAANGRALANGTTEGFVKVVADSETDRLLGVHIIGHNGSELIAEAVAHMEYGGSAEDFQRTVHAHPTMSEALKEAALAADNRALNMA